MVLKIVPCFVCFFRQGNPNTGIFINFTCIYCVNVANLWNQSNEILIKHHSSTVRHWKYFFLFIGLTLLTGSGVAFAFIPTAETSAAFVPTKQVSGTIQKRTGLLVTNNVQNCIVKFRKFRPKTVLLHFDPIVFQSFVLFNLPTGVAGRINTLDFSLLSVLSLYGTRAPPVA